MQCSVPFYDPVGPDILLNIIHAPCNRLSRSIQVCLSIYLLDNDIVEVETCNRNINEKLLFLIDYEICWTKWCTILLNISLSKSRSLHSSLCLHLSTSFLEPSGWNIANISSSFVYHLFNVLKNLIILVLDEEYKPWSPALCNSLHPPVFLFHKTPSSSVIWNE